MDENQDIMADKRYRVLVVDDDGATQKLLQLLFNRYGNRGETHFDVQKVGGEEAAAKLESDPYDIIILDTNLPYRELFVDSVEQSQARRNMLEYPYLSNLCQKAWNQNPDAKIGLYSSKAENDLKALANALGVTYYLKDGNIMEIMRSHVKRIEAS